MPECNFRFPCALAPDAAYALVYTPALDAFIFKEQSLGTLEDLGSSIDEVHEHRHVRITPTSALLNVLSLVIWAAGVKTPIAYESRQRRSRSERLVEFTTTIESLPSLSIRGWTRINPPLVGVDDDDVSKEAGVNGSVHETYIFVETGSSLFDAAASLFLERALRPEYERAAASCARYASISK